MNELHPKDFKNTLLRTFTPDIIGRLMLTRIDLEIGHEIEFPGQPINQFIFVEEGMASVTNTFEDGSQVEVGMHGFESAIGVSALMGTRRSLNRIYTQIAGWGYACSLQAAVDEFERGGLFQRLSLRCVQAQLVQSMQSAGCSSKHNMEQRLARWLLLCADRVNTDTYRLSHEFMSDMLGTTRSTVSLTAGMLKKQGLIIYSNGVVRITDRRGLEKISCECYQLIRDHLDNYAEFDNGTAT